MELRRGRAGAARGTRDAGRGRTPQQSGGGTQRPEAARAAAPPPFRTAGGWRTPLGASGPGTPGRGRGRHTRSVGPLPYQSARWLRAARGRGARGPAPWRGLPLPPPPRAGVPLPHKPSPRRPPATGASDLVPPRCRCLAKRRLLLWRDSLLSSLGRDAIRCPPRTTCLWDAPRPSRFRLGHRPGQHGTWEDKGSLSNRLGG